MTRLWEMLRNYKLKLSSEIPHQEKLPCDGFLAGTSQNLLPTFSSQQNGRWLAPETCIVWVAEISTTQNKRAWVKPDQWLVTSCVFNSHFSSANKYVAVFVGFNGGTCSRLYGEISGKIRGQPGILQFFLSIHYTINCWALASIII